MGNLRGIDFEEYFEENADDQILLAQVDGLQEAADSDQVAGEQLHCLVHLY